MVNARPLSKKNNHSRPFAFDFRSNPFTIEYRPRHLIIIGNEMNRWIKRDSVILMRGPLYLPSISVDLSGRICKLWKPPFKDKLFPETYLELGTNSDPTIELAAIEIVSRRSCFTLIESNIFPIIDGIRMNGKKKFFTYQFLRQRNLKLIEEIYERIKSSSRLYRYFFFLAKRCQLIRQRSRWFAIQSRSIARKTGLFAPCNQEDYANSAVIFAAYQN